VFRLPIALELVSRNHRFCGDRTPARLGRRRQPGRVHRSQAIARRPTPLQPSLLLGHPPRLHAAPPVELAHDRREVVADGSRRQVERARDVGNGGVPAGRREDLCQKTRPRSRSAQPP